ncbi:MAG: glycosyl hydrolase 53 family protein [Oscillospiraceae bacterium]|nr:glycosyl hydrolase 53 family protein [Oscillospiraceae bacterium]
MKLQKLTAALAAAILLTGSCGMLRTANAAESVTFSGVTGLPFENGDPFKGADISSVIALEQSGVKFYDRSGKEQDIFVTLADAGINCIRVRIWNDPTAANSGVTYGGGANDAAHAEAIAKRCAAAGLKLFVDFHYSDFWADPAKQKAPKAWASYSVQQKADAIYRYTAETLEKLGKTGAEIAMVQIGNETTAGMCGVLLSDGNWGDGVWGDLAKLWNAGAKAVREYDPDVLVALHFTNPEKTSNMQYLAKMVHQNHVDYDVFATSYYPYWHGTLQNLTSVLGNIAAAYGKKTLVAETSWAYTMKNYDPGVNTIGSEKDLGSNVKYPVSAEGQAAYLNDLFRAVAAVPNGMGIGVFYWEPAWLPVSSDYGTAMQLWKQYGGGWAYEAAQEYDPDAKDFGGSGWENQALFSADGKPLDSLYVFRNIHGNGGGTVPPESGKTGQNLLRNAGFEADGGWTNTPAGWTLRSTAKDHFDVRKEDVRSGDYALHWYSTAAFSGSTAETSVRVNESGTYRCAVNMQGDESSRYTLTAETSGGKRETVTGSGQGWSMWTAPEVQIEANAGETITLRLEVSGGDGAYGSVDDCSIAMLMQPQTTAAPVTTTEPVTTTTEPVTTTTEPVTTTTESVTTTTEPVTTETTSPAQTVRGDANCDGHADVTDAVMLCRFCLEDRGVSITDQGQRNADCDLDGQITTDDVSLLLRVIARLETF